MKIRSIIIAFLIVCVCSCAAYAAFTSNPKEGTLRLEKIPLPAVPDYLLSAAGDPYDLYIPDVICYNKNIDSAKQIILNKRLCGKSIWDKDRTFWFYGGTFLSDNNENIEKMRKMVPLVKRTVLYDRFEVLEYDANDKINYINQPSPYLVLSVVKDHGKTIWYFEGHPFRDIAITADGIYMIATDELVFYTTCDGKRIVSELYGGNRIYFLGAKRPAGIRILTDNVIRAEYDNGCIEHWKVRLSEEDVEKNMEKFKIDEKEKHLADRCLLWSNGKTSKSISQAMWCYYESEEEPAYKETNLADVRTADVSAFKRAASSSAAGNLPAKAASADAANSAGEAKTGFFASLFGRIKTFFAGLFA